ncbi:MAG: MBOAT family O-acyltransferase [Oscillospiraceae bacterium]
MPRGLQIYGLRGGKPERAVRRVGPRAGHRAAHRHLVLYLPGAFLHGRRLARGCPGAAVVCKISALHLALPQLIAGPIVRYADVAGQIDARSFDAADAFYGATRFCIGLAKKVLLADAAGKVAAQILDGSAASATTAAAWLGIVLYTFEIYFDFSGYSDMAIGMGRIFGFKYPENFRLPYTSRSITEFWRRWHISLGSFFRDYVYIPLGGKKKHQLLNMAVVWALTGLWHGASWNFVLWGLYFFVILAAEKTIGEKRLRRIPTILRRVGTMLLVILGWNIFYFTDLTQLLQHFGLLFGLLGAGFSNAQTGIQLVNNLPLLLVCAIGATSVPQNLGNLFGGVCVQGGKRSGQIVYACVTFVFDAALLALSTIALVGSTYNAFLYFRF